jgi:hypothetical protein
MKKSKVIHIFAFIVIILMANACTVSTPSPEPEVEIVVPTATIESEPTATQSNFETFSSDTYSFKYPKDYTITLPTVSFPALTVEKARNKRMEIFQMKDFGDRPFGFSGGESQEDIDGYVPKESLTVGSGEKQYNVWLFYSENDSQTIEELTAIYESIVIK